MFNSNYLHWRWNEYGALNDREINNEMETNPPTEYEVHCHHLDDESITELSSCKFHGWEDPGVVEGRQSCSLPEPLTRHPQQCQPIRCNHISEKNACALKTPHVVFLPVIFLSFFFGRSMDKLQGSFTSWPWPLTYDLDLLTWPKYASTWPQCHNSSMYVRPFTRENEMDAHTDDVKTITPITSEMWGVTSYYPSLHSGKRSYMDRQYTLSWGSIINCFWTWTGKSLFNLTWTVTEALHNATLWRSIFPIHSTLFSRVR